MIDCLKIITLIEFMHGFMEKAANNDFPSASIEKVDPLPSCYNIIRIIARDVLTFKIDSNVILVEYI